MLFVTVDEIKKRFPFSNVFFASTDKLEFEEYTFNNGTVTHNGVLTYSFPNLKAEDDELQFKEPVIFNKITNFLKIGEYCYEETDKC